MVFIAFFGISLIFYFFSVDKDKNIRSLTNNVSLFLFWLLLLSFAAFRKDIATDYGNYKSIYLLEQMEEIKRLEKGFVGLIYFIRFLVDDNYNFFFTIIAIVSMMLKYKVFKTYRSTAFAVFLYIALFYVNLEYNIIRNGLALSFLLLAVESGKEKKQINYYLFVLLAGSIHISSLIFIPFYFLTNRKFEIKSITVLIVVFIAIVVKLFVLEYILNIIVLLLGKLFSLSAMVQHLAVYLITGDFKISSGLIRRLIILFAYIILSGNKKEKDCYFILFFIGIVIYTLFMGNDIFAYRIALSFDIFQIPMFANSNIKITKKNIVVLLLLVGLLFLTYYSPLDGYVLPYKSYL